MKDTNSVTIVGRLVRDAEIKSVSVDAEVAVFDIAFNTSKKSGDGWQDVTNYMQVQYWNPKGLSSYLKKGQQVIVSAEIHHEKWDKDGETRHKHFLRANQIQLSGNKSDS